MDVAFRLAGLLLLLLFLVNSVAGNDGFNISGKLFPLLPPTSIPFPYHFLIYHRMPVAHFNLSVRITVHGICRSVKRKIIPKSRNI